MSAGRASGALSRTRTPLEPGPEPEPEPEPNHRYRVGRVVRTGGAERGDEAREYRLGRGLQRPGSGRHGGADADSGAILAPAARESRPIALCSVLGRDLNAGPAGKGDAVGTRQGSGTRVVEEGLRSRRLAPLARTSTPAPDSSSGWVGGGAGPPRLPGFRSRGRRSYPSSHSQLQPPSPRRRPGPRSPPGASCRNHSLTWSRPSMGCTCSSCLCWSSSSWAW